MSVDMPDAYKLGWIKFCNLVFKVNPNVLIPRFETEQLVNEVVAFVNKSLSSEGTIKILDVGTGSGCIAIALAKAIPSAQVVATDISKEALIVAQENAKTHRVQNQITFIQTDLLTSVESKADIIVANLPYIPSERIPTLDSSVKDFEPLVALDGGPDGFDVYRKLFKQIAESDIDPKIIIVEIDDTHKKVAIDEARLYFPEAHVEVKKDVSNFDRVLIIANDSS